MNFILKTKKSFSLIETIVSLGIIGIIMILFFNVITRIIFVSLQVNARSRAREEISSIVNLLKIDIRNADEIRECENLYCNIFVEGKEIVWRECTDDETRLCRYQQIGDTQKLTYRLPTDYFIEYAAFEEGFADNTSSSKRNIGFSIAISSQNPNINVVNVLSSINVSTRNYSLDTVPIATCGNGIIEIGEQCDSIDGCDDSCLFKKIVQQGINSRWGLCSLGRVPINQQGVTWSSNGADVNPFMAEIPDGAHCVSVVGNGLISWGGGPFGLDGDGGGNTGFIGCTGWGIAISPLASNSLAMAGVFTSAQQPLVGRDPIPSALDFRGFFINIISRFAPQINQTFVVGDGRNNSGTVQNFIIPQGARFFHIGFFDNWGFRDTDRAQAYGDNGTFPNTRFELQFKPESECN